MFEKKLVISIRVRGKASFTTFHKKKKKIHLKVIRALMMNNNLGTKYLILNDVNFFFFLWFPWRRIIMDTRYGNPRVLMDVIGRVDRSKMSYGDSLSLFRLFCVMFGNGPSGPSAIPPGSHTQTHIDNCTKVTLLFRMDILETRIGDGDIIYMKRRPPSLHTQRTLRKGQPLETI